MDWICDDAWIGPFTQAMFFVGAAIGAIVFGYVSDIYGRYPTFVASNVVSARHKNTIHPYANRKHYLGIC